ncbi:MAG: arsenite methyltransferase [Deltaproteobacteria bacterium]|nr:arsenite methyltransferase [Deltaproteobacteria bacterium]
MRNEKIKKIIKEKYGKIAYEESSCCTQASCYGESADLARDIGKKIGYSEEELKTIPEGANLGLGCGNPVALASLKEGETVLDLGSGAGFDCFLAARAVGPEGKVIGVDMTREMVEKAKDNARRSNVENVEFRAGDIEDLPVSDSSVDAVISNCVINLVPDKSRVFQEAYRVLKPGGRLMISDIVLLSELPDPLKNSIEAYVGCLSGAMLKDEYLGAIRGAGFQRVEIVDEGAFPIEWLSNDPIVKRIVESLKLTSESLAEAINSVISISVFGVKP